MLYPADAQWWTLQPARRARAGRREAVIVEQVDLADMDAFRLGWPFLGDRRIDAYSQISERFIEAERE